MKTKSKTTASKTEKTTFMDRLRSARTKPPASHDQLLAAMTDLGEVLTTEAIHAQLIVDKQWAELWIQPRHRPADKQRLLLLREDRCLWNGDQIHWLTTAAEFRKFLLMVAQTKALAQTIQNMEYTYEQPVRARIDPMSTYGTNVEVSPEMQARLAESNGPFEITVAVWSGYQSWSKYSRLHSAGIIAKIDELVYDNQTDTTTIKGRRC